MAQIYRPPVKALTSLCIDTESPEPTLLSYTKFVCRWTWVQTRTFYLRKISIIFLPINLNICFGCSKEPSHWDGSFEYPKHMFWMRNKENNFPIRTLYWRPGWRPRPTFRANLDGCSRVGCSKVGCSKVAISTKISFAEPHDKLFLFLFWLSNIYVHVIYHILYICPLAVKI